MAVYRRLALRSALGGCRGIAEARHPNQADVVICGGGIAGIAAAHELSIRRGVDRVVIVEEGHPLSLTSDKSFEGYRNMWPAAMVPLANRSIDLLESLSRETDNYFSMNRRGYIVMTRTEEGLHRLTEEANQLAAAGAGPLRVHDGRTGEIYTPAPGRGWETVPVGVDLVTHPDTIREYFPHFDEECRAVLHARRCGWIDAQQLGMYLLSKFKEGGGQLVKGRVQSVDWDAIEGVRGVEVQVAGSSECLRINTDVFINCGGPHIREVSEMVGHDLPYVYCEQQHRISVRDRDGVLPTDVGLTILGDPTELWWTEEEAQCLRDLLPEDPSIAALLTSYPAGVCGRPCGNGWILHWDNEPPSTPRPMFPLDWDPQQAEIVARGIAMMIPGFRRYCGDLPDVVIDGGYYTRTEENRPIVSPVPGVRGAYVMGAFGGFGIQMSMACADLLGAVVTKGALPEYAGLFDLRRYDDPQYLVSVLQEGTGQI